MKLLIDNLDGGGPRDYTPAVDAAQAPRVLRRKNRPSELRFSLLADTPDFIVPANGARIILGRTNGTDVFTGYIAKNPDFEYLGWQERGPLYRYRVVAISDEFLLDRKTVPDRHPFVARSAGDALRQLTDDLLPGVFDTADVQDVEPLGWYVCERQKSWTEHAAEIGLRSRAAYRASGGKLTFAPIGQTVHVLDESDPSFSPEALKFASMGRQLNDVIVLGRTEPQAHVKDYFVGDGLSLKFFLSQQPFSRNRRVLLDEEYRGGSLDQTRWTASGPPGVITVHDGTLEVVGGTGIDGQTSVVFVESVELGGALSLQHGQITFTGASNGLLGGLYAGDVSTANCVAGFRITPAASSCNIQAIVNGIATGAVLTTRLTHRYALTTRIYASEIYRNGQGFHSSVHPGGNGRGGGAISASARIVLEVHDIDPNNPGSMIAPSIVLYDGVLAGTPGFCAYALVNAADMHATVAFTRIIREVDAEVRSALPGEAFRTRLAGSLSEGSECRVTSEPALQFFPAYVPAANEQIVVRYRGYGQANARVTDPADIASHMRAGDDGIRAGVLAVKSPPPRTSAECENAALAVLDDSVSGGWSGEYTCWSDFLPAADVHPGDALEVNAPSRAAVFQAVVQEVDIQLSDLSTEHSLYKLTFADDVAAPCGFEFEPAGTAANRLLDDPPANAGDFLADLTAAEVTQVASTAITIDAGVAPPAGGGIEVRWSDAGWGQENDRNLVGRFATRIFAVPRLGRVQSYFLRQYNAAAKYSRYSAALHVDFPL